MQVEKRDGSLVDFDMSKIKKVIGWACSGLKVNAVELESHIDLIFTSGISTSKIQDNLIQHAVKLTTELTPDWKYVAGRLVIMPRWKHNLGHKSFSRFIESKVLSGEYTNSLLFEYTDEELEYLGEHIVNSRDLDYDYAGANLLVNRYLINGESPQIALMAISALLALPEGTSHRLDMAIRFYEALSTRKISLATPLLMNLRKPNGNLASCFVLSMEDSLNGITDVWNDVAQISKNGGGVGICISKVRAKGAEILGVQGASSGVVPCIKVLNDIALYIDQGGKRSGAFTIALDTWHLDLEDFLEMQSETGDLRSKSFDIFPQLVMCDSFMEAAESNSDWYLFDPYEVEKHTGKCLPDLWGEVLKNTLVEARQLADSGIIKLFKVISARDILKKVIKSYLETGLPYISFKDTWNRDNPNKHAGYIPCANLCMESVSNVSSTETHVCQLVSLVLANCEISEVPGLASLATRLLDNAIDLTIEPTEKAKLHNGKYRVIGIGVLGLADLIAKQGLSYMHVDVDNFVSEIFEDIAYHAALESCKLAMDRGAYKMFDGSDWQNGNRISRLKAQSKYPDKWSELQVLINEYGIRNGQQLAIAPNTSSSLIMGCSASILPVFNKFFIDNNSNGAVPIVAKYIKDYFWGYTEYKNMDHFKMNNIIRSMQKWIDTGISYELLFNLNDENITAKYIYDVILDAWSKDIKSLYYARMVTKSGDVTSKEECISCAG